MRNIFIFLCVMVSTLTHASGPLGSLAHWTFEDAGGAGTTAVNSYDISLVNPPVDITQVGLISEYRPGCGSTLAWANRSWQGGSININDNYAEFTLDPIMHIEITEITFVYYKIIPSSTPQELEIRYDIDGYGSAIAGGSQATTATTCTSISFSFSPCLLRAAGQPVTFRIYGYNSGGFGRVVIDDLMIMGGAPTPLPVEWLSFKGLYWNERVELEWQTASEINNSHFTVLQSCDVVQWQTIDVVTGSGNSSSTQTYNSTDSEPCPETTYYQVKQVDFDGETDSSKVIAVEAPRSHRIDFRNLEGYLVFDAKGSQIPIQRVPYVESGIYFFVPPNGATIKISL